MDAPTRRRAPIPPSAPTCSPASPRRSRRSRRAGSTTAAARSCSRRSPGFPNIIRPAPRPPCSSATAARSRRSLGDRRRRWSSSARARRPRPRSCCARSRPSAYVPIDISGDFLRESAAALQAEFPGSADPSGRGRFHPADRICRPRSRRLPKLGFFPGSTIGNLVAAHRGRSAARDEGDAGRGLAAADRHGPDQGRRRAARAPMTTRPASPPRSTSTCSTGSTPSSDGDIPVDAFRHRAIWNDAMSRIEMHLEALRDVAFTVAGQRFAIPRGRDHPHREQPQIRPSRQPPAAARRRLGRGRGMDRRGGAGSRSSSPKPSRRASRPEPSVAAHCPARPRRYRRRTTPAPERPCCLPCSTSSTCCCRC